MGYIRHDAIIVTAWDTKRLTACAAKADELGLRHTEIVESEMNGYASFLIVPDGSKEGWEDSNSGEALRAAWIAWARANRELWVDWALVNYGGDEPEYTRVTDHNGNEADEANTEISGRADERRETMRTCTRCGGQLPDPTDSLQSRPMCDCGGSRVDETPELRMGLARSLGRLVSVFFRAWKEYADDGGNYWVRLAWERGCFAGELRFGGPNPYKPGTDKFRAWEHGHYVGTRNANAASQTAAPQTTQPKTPNES